MRILCSIFKIASHKINELSSIAQLIECKKNKLSVTVGYGIDFRTDIWLNYSDAKKPPLLHVLWKDKLSRDSNDRQTEKLSKMWM